ncbi:Alpha/Beta hydrolase protein [Coniochaeta sp. 2T2.1]|nr:Alpha/Beta hydrolase protein [Coniochaeta sp. 2T2.1]
MLNKAFFQLVITAAMVVSSPSPPAPSRQGGPDVYVPPYATLPPTPVLPRSAFQGTARINNIDLWYARYGPSLECGHTPVVMLHGGKISSQWWTPQIKYLASQGYPVIAIDTRAHGRSTDDPTVPLSYDLFADDAAALLKHLNVKRASFVGWSDGANTCLSLAMRHGDIVDRCFAFGANYRFDQLNITGLLGIPFLADVAARQENEWKALSPTGPEGWASFKARMDVLQGTMPVWDGGDFAKIKTLYQDPKKAPIMWIADGDSEEIVLRQVAGEIRDMIWGSSLVTLPGVGHFAPLQDPDTFDALLDRFLTLRR